MEIYTDSVSVTSCKRWPVCMSDHCKVFFFSVDQVPLVVKNPLANAGDVRDMGAISSILAWRIPWTEEPGGLTSQRV